MPIAVSEDSEAKAARLAAARGITVEEYVDSLIQSLPEPSSTVPPAVPRRTDAERLAVVRTYLALPPEEAARRHAPAIARITEELAATQEEARTPDAVRSAEQELQEFMDRMNAERRLRGAEPLYIEPTDKAV
jgi:uncharacterized protein YkwD